MKLKVTTEFIDKYTKELYKVGRVIEVDDSLRVDDLVSRKLAEIEEGKKSEVSFSVFGTDVDRKAVKSALKEVGSGVANNATDDNISEKIAGLTDDQVIELKKILSIV